VRELTSFPLFEISALVRSRQLSPVELTQACLARIEQFNSRLNAFITVTADLARQQARVAEAEIQHGKWRGPLHGIPISLKDLIDTAGVRTTAASELFKDRVPEADAEVVRRLSAAGAVLLGKTNLHEFAYGGSCLVSCFGTVHNPWDLGRVTGGSSGGAAAAVAAGMCFAAIGTDTAGSVRMPAGCCGIVGIKPTYGLVSTRGVIPLSWSYDTVGPITRNVRDAALVLQAIAGYDEQDLASVPLPAEDYSAALEHTTSMLRVGVAREYFFADLDGDVATAVDHAIATINHLTSETREVAVPVDPDYTVHTSEAFAYHAKFTAESPNLYQSDTLRRIRSGEKASAADYIQKRHELQRLRRAVPAVFREVDVIVTPTAPILPPMIAELERDPRELRRKETALLRNTRPFNVLGVPAISVPCGYSSAGLAVGMQISGRPGEDATVLALAHAYERATNWNRMPPLA
jgi:aspartyl-tRNA(Asn)/glutamyl-tRNA(Gln) amidotransferase subunit A